MDRRRCLWGWLVSALVVILVAGTASSASALTVTVPLPPPLESEKPAEKHKQPQKPPHKKPQKEPEKTKEPAPKTDNTCVVKSLDSFHDQGEFGTDSSIADIIQVACKPVHARQLVTLESQQLFNRCADKLSWSVPYPYHFVEGPTFTVTLDNNGNATAALWGGPGCAPGKSQISAHLEKPPFTTATTWFTVLPAEETPENVFATPSSQVEDTTTSSVATVIQVEFEAVYSQEDVIIRAGQLLARCKVKPRLVWVGPDQHVIGTSTGTVELKLDNSGNAFVVVLGGGSCAAGDSEIEASLEESPYTSLFTHFKVLPPKPLNP